MGRKFNDLMKFTFNFKFFNFKCLGYFKFFIWKEKVSSNSSVLVVFGENKFTEGTERHSNVKVVVKKKTYLLSGCYKLVLTKWIFFGNKI